MKLTEIANIQVTVRINQILRDAVNATNPTLNARFWEIKRKASKPEHLAYTIEFDINDSSSPIPYSYDEVPDVLPLHKFRVQLFKAFKRIAQVELIGVDVKEGKNANLFLTILMKRNTTD